ncbi:MAG: YdcF family protein [Vicinamibacterales bacterium]
MYSLVSDLAQPYPIAVIALLVVAIGLRRAPLSVSPWHGRIALSAAVVLYLTSIGGVARPLIHSLERQYEPVEWPTSQPPAAIVVLSGGFRRGPDGRGSLAEDTTLRCLHGLDLYRKTPAARLVVSGGILSTGPPTVAVAEGMRDFLIRQGVPAQAILVERRSQTTFENAAETFALLQPLGMTRIALVTEAFHMPRSVAVFVHQGFDVVPAPFNHHTERSDWSVRDLTPAARHAATVSLVLHEWLGLGWYRLRGRL